MRSARLRLKVDARGQELEMTAEEEKALREKLPQMREDYAEKVRGESKVGSKFERGQNPDPRRFNKEDIEAVFEKRE